MSEFLSDEWVRALDARLSTATGGSSPTQLVVEYRVARSDGSTATYHLTLGPDADHAVLGQASDPDVTFSMDIDTARRISDGELSTEEAFLTGLLDLDGDTGALIDAHRTATEET